MGPRFGKLYSYDMSDQKKSSESPGDESSKDSVADDGSSDGKSSGGDGSSSWRSKLEKKSRRFKGSSSKKDFFGKRSKKWPMRGLVKRPETEVDSPPMGSMACVCTSYRRTSSEDQEASSTSMPGHSQHTFGFPIIDLSKFNPADYPIDDEDERMRQERAKEMQEGVDLTTLLAGGLSFQDSTGYPAGPAHSQVDYIHYLVPDLKEITSCSFYWGKIDRYEAEKLLEGKPEGTFLLRDSAQEEYLFSVSFRRYGRSLHARIEQWNNQFSFDSHDPSVFSSRTVTGLIEHYKDPSCCMFFEPMLTTPLHRNFPFDLQHLARSVICSRVTYDSINQLPLPKSLKMYCKEYHYKQRVRIRRLE